MAFKTRRQTRYMLLRNSGFLKGEARPLSKVPLKTTPYMRSLVAERKAEYKKAVAAKMSQTAYEDKIKEKYDKNRWLTAGKVRIKRDPWKMLRDYEDRWRARNPQYTSPWEKRWKTWRGFVKKAERTIARQKKGQA